jgi:hypothetical protein
VLAEEGRHAVEELERLVEADAVGDRPVEG